MTKSKKAALLLAATTLATALSYKFITVAVITKLGSVLAISTFSVVMPYIVYKLSTSLWKYFFQKRTRPKIVQTAALQPQDFAGESGMHYKIQGCPSHITITPFYDKNAPYYELTNFDMSTPINLDGKHWSTTEHYFQANKFPRNSNEYNAIRNATSARDALNKAKTYSQHWTQQDYANWNAKKVRVMRAALEAKINQHPRVRALLVGTTNSCLVEDSAPNDERIWGWGIDGMGTNLLGLIWMKIRNECHRQDGNPHYQVAKNDLYNIVQQARMQLGRTPKMLQDLTNIQGSGVTFANQHIQTHSYTFTPARQLHENPHYRASCAQGYGKRVSECFYNLLGIRVSVSGTFSKNLSCYVEDYEEAKALETWLNQNLTSGEVYLQSTPENFNDKTMWRISVKSQDVYQLFNGKLKLDSGFIQYFKNRYKIN